MSAKMLKIVRTHMHMHMHMHAPRTLAFTFAHSHARTYRHTHSTLTFLLVNSSHRMHTQMESLFARHCPVRIHTGISSQSGVQGF